RPADLEVNLVVVEFLKVYRPKTSGFDFIQIRQGYRYIHFVVKNLVCLPIPIKRFLAVEVDDKGFTGSVDVILPFFTFGATQFNKIGRASCRESGCSS